MFKKYLTCIACSFFLVLFVNLIAPQNTNKKAVLNVGRWPLSIKNRLILSQIFFLSGDEENAVKEFNRVKKINEFFSFFKFRLHSDKIFTETEKIIFSRQKLEQERDFWEMKANDFPHFKDIYLRLTIINFQLQDSKKSWDYWQKAFYLNPNDKKVQEIKEIIN